MIRKVYVLLSDGELIGTFSSFKQAAEAATHWIGDGVYHTSIFESEIQF